jgi:hypothetical protein
MKEIHMKKKSLCLIVFVCLMGSLAPLSSISATPLEGTTQQAEWVMMFYLNGDNKLSSALQQTLTSIRNVGSTNDVHIAVLIDGSGEDDTKLYYITGNTLEAQEWPSESDMDDATTLVEFAEKVMTDHPANQYGLAITSNKGSGWQGVCFDEHGDGIMITMPELLDAFKEITDNGANNLDMLIVESCLCGNLEFRYQVHSYCDYTVGYADCGIVGDIAYATTLTDLVNNPAMTPMTLATTFVDNFVPQDLPFYKIKQAFGAVESQRLDALAQAIDDLALYFIDHLDDYSIAIQQALQETRKYGLTWNIEYFVDLAHFLDLITINDPAFTTIKNTVLDRIDDAVIAKAILEDDHSCGLNFYFPGTKGDYYNALRYENDPLPSPYVDTLYAMDTNWDEFLNAYLHLEENNPSTNPTINGPPRGKAGEEYSFTVSATDPDGDDVYLYVEFCDTANTGWIGPYESGEEVDLSHTWETSGAKLIKAKSRDVAFAESDWSTLEVTMPKTKILMKPLFDLLKNRLPIIIFLQQLFEQFEY